MAEFESHIETTGHVTEAGALGAQYAELYDHDEIAGVVGVGEDERPVHLAVVPDGRKVISLKPFFDEFRARPERVRGEAKIGDLDSFMAHVARFSLPDIAAVFANPDRTAPSLMAIYDYSDAGVPAFHGHRAKYACPLSDEWKAWAALDGKLMAQGDFAAFLEDRIGDCVIPPAGDEQLDEFVALVGATLAGPQKLVELSRGLAVTVETKVKQALSLSNGTATVQFEEKHAGEGGQTLVVPNFFLITIPVFRSGPAYRIAVRLRYRVRAGEIAWSYQLYRADKVFDDAFGEIVAHVRAAALPVFVGSPEA